MLGGATSLASDVAEREGFEPSIPLRGYWISSPAHSTTLTPLHIVTLRSTRKSVQRARLGFS